MKNHDEFKKAVFEKAAEYEKQRKARSKKIIESMSLCSLALMIGIGAYFTVPLLNSMVNDLSDSTDSTQISTSGSSSSDTVPSYSDDTSSESSASRTDLTTTTMDSEWTISASQTYSEWTDSYTESGTEWTTESTETTASIDTTETTTSSTDASQVDCTTKTTTTSHSDTETTYEVPTESTVLNINQAIYLFSETVPNVVIAEGEDPKVELITSAAAFRELFGYDDIPIPLHPEYSVDFDKQMLVLIYSKEYHIRLNTYAKGKLFVELSQRSSSAKTTVSVYAIPKGEYKETLFFRIHDIYDEKNR